MRMNPLLRTDSYKVSHPRMYVDGATYLKTYTAAHKGDKNITWLGHQIFVKQLAETVITKDDVREAQLFAQKHFLGADFFPADDFYYMIKEYGGKFAVRIKAVPEGLSIPSNNVLATCESTDERLFWLTSWMETACLRAQWYGPTVATRDMAIAADIYRSLLLSCDNPEAAFPSRHHDFGARGATSGESAEIAGAVHCLIFQGSDTMEGIYVANKVYGGDMAAYSIPASEHSVTTSHGRADEFQIINKSLTRFPGAPLVANVVDSYDMMNFVDNYIGKKYKQDIINSGKVYVVRPDSGDAVANIKQIFPSLERNFGVKMNNRGFKVLNHVAVINGDANDNHKIHRLLDAVMDMGFSTENIAFGNGGFLHQREMDRDTLNFTTKLCLAKVNGQLIPVSKDAPGKKSLGGDIDLIEGEEGYQTIDRLTVKSNAPSVLETVYENGETPTLYTIDEVRTRTFNEVVHEASNQLTIVPV